MEMGLLQDYCRNFSMPYEKYYFCMEESMQVGFNPCEVRLKRTSEMNIGGYPNPSQIGGRLGVARWGQMGAEGDGGRPWGGARQEWGPDWGGGWGQSGPDGSRCQMGCRGPYLVPHPLFGTTGQ